MDALTRIERKRETLFARYEQLNVAAQNCHRKYNDGKATSAQLELATAKAEVVWEEFQAAEKEYRALLDAHKVAA